MTTTPYRSYPSRLTGGGRTITVRVVGQAWATGEGDGQEHGVVSVVTGAAGFIGSALCRRLLAEGATVRGVDHLADVGDHDRRMAAIGELVQHPAFERHDADLAADDLEPALDDAEVVYHLAGRSGVRPSWVAFAEYTRNNLEATDRLLRACVTGGPRAVVCASSSSVYGDAETLPTPETALPRPVSPYGVTKLATEHLCHAYGRRFDLATVALRLFTVYGPGQRPDMACARLVRAAVAGGRFVVHGDGGQSRDFTFVDDAVDGFVRAGASGWTGVANIAGGTTASLHEVVALVEDLVGPIDVVRGPAAAGDARRTSADITLAREVLGYRPATSLADGLAAMVDQARAVTGATGPAPGSVPER